MVPVLKSRAAHTEELRRIPDETVQDLRAAGLNRIEVPNRFGGLDVADGLVFQVGEELARGCASSSWCYSVWGANAYMAGFWPLQAQEELFADGPDVLLSSSLTPGTSKTEPVNGGYRLTGRWEFSSGCDAAGWVMVGAASPEGHIWLLLPRSGYEIVDTWFVSGLKGTGSKDIIIKDAFVPKHRVVYRDRAGDQDLTGWDIHQSDRYRMPLAVLLGWDLVAPMLGIAMGMIEEFTGLLTGTSGPGRTADSEGVQLRLSQAAAEVDAALALMRSDIREIFTKAGEGDGFTTLERVRFRRDKAFVAQQCLNSVNRLFEFSGGHAIFNSEAAQRYHRDIQAAVRRDGFMMELGGLQYGRVALGLEPDARI